MQFKDIFVFAWYKMCEELFDALKRAIVCLGWKEQESTLNSYSQVRDFGAYEIARIFEHSYSIMVSFPPLRPVLVNRKEWLGYINVTFELISIAVVFFLMFLLVKHNWYLQS